MPSKPRSQRKLDRIDIDELFSSPSNRGMLSFLERPPEEARLRLEQKRQVDAHQAARSESPTVGDLPTERDLPLASVIAFHQVLPEGNLPPAGDLPSECELPAEGNLPTEGESLPGSYGLVSASIGKLPTVGDSHTADDLPSAQKAIDAAFIGRRQKIRRANSVQDGHSSGEQLLYQALWSAAKPEGNETRLISAGYQAMSFLCKLEKSNCKKNIIGLISKLSVEIADKYDSEARVGTTYRIFSYKEILRRRETAGLVWVIRTSGVRFVSLDPTIPDPSHHYTGGESPTVGDLPTECDLPSVGNSPAVGETPTAPVGDSPTGAVGKTPTLIGIRGNKESTTAAAVIQVLRDEIGQADDEAAIRIVAECRKRAPDATDEEITVQVRSQAKRLARNRRVSNPVGLLIAQVPKYFEGESFRQLREDSRRIEEQGREAPAGPERSTQQWKQRYQAILSDPAASEHERRVALAALEKT